MVHYTTVATCALNQWALDFEGNYQRIRESILQAKALNARLRIGPELEIPGYGCYDHFLERDTVQHSWEVLGRLLEDRSLDNILIDTGMPVLHRNTRYNCRVIILNGKIVLIRPKMYMANDGLYREMRWFVGWTKQAQTEEFVLPRFIARMTGQRSVMFGDALVSTDDSCLGIELCEELFTPESPHIAMSLDGAEIIINSSGSHHELRKLKRRVDLITEATLKCGGIYLYSNQKGCDGDRMYYDGAAMVLVNGELLAMTSQFSIADVEVQVATVDLGAVRSFRAAIASRSMQAARAQTYPRAHAPFALSVELVDFDNSIRPTDPIPARYHTPAEEINMGPACWLWDYLRRSGQGGFFLPLSGGLDSCSTALIVHSMCRQVTAACKRGDQQVLHDVRQCVGAAAGPDYVPESAQELASHLFYTCYMGTENSSKETRARAAHLAKAIGSYHVDLNMDTVVSAIVALFTLVTARTPRYEVHGGSRAENLALQNIQARLRMLLAYLFAALLPWVRGRQRSVLVLGSANVDESLRGYFTKYDCSSADLNPIGSISKADLRKYVAYARDQMKLPVLDEFLEAMPSAELVPHSETYAQSDEVEMGMSYEELSVFGRLRKIEGCGPYSMVTHLLHIWGEKLTPREIADKVKRFFFYYSINRHKMTTITPAYHAETYSPDDNRFDLRPFLYNSSWTWQFKAVDDLIDRIEQRETSAK
ncbi:glutamine-dependent NAD(+) synthetase [Coemansia sp. RSA 989]|nr:glutamine-dependent NAD(+) synthetase [Coemansia sp. RSA 1086]KAJ1749028.1 glutamine-dependent NAD(+) synthetase [Coemansia sp. RSA 1821]KAJ1862272.1 glutamine-dependent NAD(+) synthetase [Coemansia sp. RSA 989]KAJ1873536.1 glutamine-dependent NAD(+) synthetase [Coemansia sp. RSA 990]